jgi:O-antigen/teichoic acid export membrane protein
VTETTREKAGRNLFWSTTGWYATFILAFLFSLVTARLLAPSVFGLVTLALSIVVTAQLFADGGTRAALVHRPDPIDDAVSTMMIAVPLFGFLGSVAIFLVAPFIADFFNEPTFTDLARVLCWTLFLFSLSIVPDALLQRRMDLKYRRAVVDPLSVILYGTTVIVLAAGFGLREWALVIGQFAQVLTITIGCLVLARPQFRAGRASVATYRSVARYGRGILTANAIETVNTQAENVVLGHFLGKTQVGLFNAGLRVGKIPLTGITQIAGSVVFPALSRLQDDLPRFRKTAYEALRLMSMIMVPVCVILIALGEPLIVVAFGEKWRQAGGVLQLLGLWALCLSLAEHGREVFKAIGRPFFVARNALFEAAALVIYLLILWATDNFTLLNVAAGRIVAGVALLAVAAIGVRKVIDMGLGKQWTAIQPAILGGVAQLAVMAAIVFALPSGIETWTHIGSLNLGPVIPLLGLGAVSAAGLAAYAVAVWLVDKTALAAVKSNLKIALRGRSG